MYKIKIGDKIRDIEDGDCYYEGIVVSVNPVKYRITNILWSNEIDDSMNEEVIELKWWLLQVFKGKQWFDIIT
jgi:hypothetical protein